MTMTMITAASAANAARRRRRLGQHFLNSEAIASDMAGAAGITGDDTVLEIGTGEGILVPHLCRSAKRVVSIEADPRLYGAARSRFSSLENLELVRGDGFKTAAGFSVFVSSLPYSQSRTAVRWLCQRRFSRAVIMVQKEFADKLAAPVRGGGGAADTASSSRAVSVIANHCFDIRQVIRVGRNNFSPPPEVDSVVLRLDQRRVLPPAVIGAVDRMFSYRRKAVPGIMRRLGMRGGAPQGRLDDLSIREIIGLARSVARG